MQKIKLGRTDLIVNKNGFGALPIQRASFDEAKRILRKAFDSGIDFYDTARAYTDSEEKIANGLADVRKEIILASKTFAKNKEELFQDLDTSLTNLKTDYLDLYQLHNPGSLPGRDQGDALYEALLEAKKMGKVRYIGITNHKHDIIRDAIRLKLYDTVQFPFSYLSSQEDLEIIEECKKHEVGFIAMKAMAGGLITNATAAFAYMSGFDNVLPIWGIQRESELEEFLSFEVNPPLMDDRLQFVIEKDKTELGGNFCRGCGYCMPCPVGIPINFATRISYLLRRMPGEKYLGKEWKAKMDLIEQCTACGHCKNNCPYHLEVPDLLRKELAEYRKLYEANIRKDN